jgi:hypothetical protein
MSFYPETWPSEQFRTKMFVRRGTPGYRGTVPDIFFVFCLFAPSRARPLLSCSLPVPGQLRDSGSTPMRQRRQTGVRAQPLTISQKKRLSVQLEQRERFMKDILGTLMATLLVMLALITLLTAEQNWEPSNEPVVSNPERVSDLGLRLALKSH